MSTDEASRGYSQGHEQWGQSFHKLQHLLFLYTVLKPSINHESKHLFCLSKSKSSNTIKFFLSGHNSRGSGTSLAFSKNLHSISDFCV